MTKQSKYADWMEVSVYNALLGALKADGSDFAKYSPLEGSRFRGEGQCGMTIHCCSANGPRGFVAIPESIVMRDTNALFVNLYMPSTVETMIPASDRKVTLIQQTSYPESGGVKMTVEVDSEQEFALNLRIPEWSRQTEIKVNGTLVNNVTAGTFKEIKRVWKSGDRIEAEFDFRGRVLAENHHIALMRGPIVYARDIRFDDGFIDQAGNFAGDQNGYIELKAVSKKPDGIWMAVTADMVLGTTLDGEAAKARPVCFCDFASAGSTWDLSSYYRVWLRQVMDVR